MFATSSAQETAKDAVQVFGGRGITKTGMGSIIEMVFLLLFINKQTCSHHTCSTIERYLSMRCLVALKTYLQTLEYGKPCVKCLRMFACRVWMMIDDRGLSGRILAYFSIFVLVQLVNQIVCNAICVFVYKIRSSLFDILYGCFNTLHTLFQAKNILKSC
jgi:hypothetical protein